MNKLNFKDLTPDTKKEMIGLIDRWKRTKTSVHVLAESLSALASDKRFTAKDFSRIVDDTSCIATTWGRRNQPKLALGKEHAGLLLGLVSGIEGLAKEDHCLATRMVDAAVSILIKGNKPPSTITDPSWEGLLKLMSSMDPKIVQGSLF